MYIMILKFLYHYGFNFGQINAKTVLVLIKKKQPTVKLLAILNNSVHVIDQRSTASDK